MARPVHLLLTGALSAAAALAVISFTGSPDAPQESNAIAPARVTAPCAATIDEWMISTSWPADEVLLGDQIYGRARLWSLASSRGNAVADLALAMATAQLNVAAGAEPSADVIEALFQADGWLLDEHEDAQESQRKSSEIRTLVSTLSEFNDWAAAASDCAPNGGALAMHAQN